MAFKIERPEHVEEMRALVNSGDLDLSETKAAFLSATGSNTTLTDDDLLALHASQDDAYGMDDMVKRMVAAEAGEPINWNGEQP